MPPSLDAAVSYPTAEPHPGPVVGLDFEPAKRPSAAELAVDFEAIYEDHFDFVWRNLRRLGVQEAQLDDAAQEVFLVVHRRLAEFEGRSSLKTWLFGILVRVAGDCRRAVRRKSPHARSPGGAVDADSVADEAAESAHDRTARSEAVRLLHRLLDELDDDKRAVFVLAELEQMSAPEIAESLGQNLNTIYARLRAARREFEQAALRERARDTWRLR
ncbi:MAG: sigma-70 family RNA polymerase sigma factor [Byssovorax sp.]